MGAKLGAGALALRLRLTRDGRTVLGPGRADLLEHIEAKGSIAAAGREMGMSYKRAWALVEAMNAIFENVLVEAAKGGVGGGGARLTPQGRVVLAAYRGLETSARQAGEVHLAAIMAAMQVPPDVKDG